MRGIVLDGKYSKHEKERGKVRFVQPAGAWTINLAEVSKEAMITGQVKTLELITEKRIYSVKAKEAMQKGFYRKLGGEDKWVIPLHVWTVKAKS